MQLSDEQLQQLIRESQEEIKSLVLEKVKEDLTWHVRQVLKDGLASEIAEFIKAEILPDVQLALRDSKAGIIAGAVKASDEIAEMVRESLVEVAKKNLSSSYERGKIAKAIFD